MRRTSAGKKLSLTPYSASLSTYVEGKSQKLKMTNNVISKNMFLIISFLKNWRTQCRWI
jgi:hypothetical protein